MHEKPSGFPGFKVSPAAYLIDGIQHNRLRRIIPAGCIAPDSRHKFAGSGAIPAIYWRTEFDQLLGLGQPKSHRHFEGQNVAAFAATGRASTRWHSYLVTYAASARPVATA